MTTTIMGQTFYYRQDDCHAECGTNTFFVARDRVKKDGTTTKIYTSFPNDRKYFIWASKIDEKDKNFYEQIKAGTPCWEYYDIDDWPNKSISPEQLFHEFMIHRKAFGETLGLETNGSDFIVLDSSKYDLNGNLTKGSLHILSNAVSFPNSKQHLEFFQQFTAYLPSEFPRMDKSVYSNNRVFRLENNTKIGELRPLKRKYWGECDGWIPYLITVDVEKQKFWSLQQEILDERNAIQMRRREALKLLPKVEGLEGIFYDIVSYIKEGKHPKGDVRFGNTSLGYAEWLKFTYAVKGALGMDFVEKNWDTIYYLYGKSIDSCVQSQLTSITNKHIDPDTTSFMYWAKPLQKFQEEHPDHCEVLNTYDLPRDIQYEECKNINVNGFELVSYVELLKDYDTIFVRANMGAGKTEKLNGVFSQYKHIVLISSKRTLSYDLKRKNPDFVHYEDLKGDINVNIHKKVIVQVDSLYRIVGKVDLLIADEFLDLTSQILQSQNRTVSNDAFQYYIEKSSKIIVMDANLDRIDFFKNVRNMNRAVFIKDQKVYHRDKHITEYHEDDEKQFFSDILDNGEGRMYIPSDSKKFIDDISKMYIKKYPERKVLVLTSDSNHIDRKEDWDNYDVIFCSPTVTAGVSHKSRIDHVYGYYSKRSINAWSATQQLLRCRNWVNANIYFGENSKNINALVNDDELEKYIEDRFNTEFKEFQGLKIDRINVGFEKNFIYYMYLENQKREKRSEKFFRYYFLKIMREHGIKSQKINLPEIDEVETKKLEQKLDKIDLEKKITAYESKEALIKAIVDADPIDTDMENFKSRKLDHIDKATLEYIHLRETYGFVVREKEWVETYIDKRKQYKNIKKTVQNLDVPTQLSANNYSHLDIKEQNGIQRRTLGLMFLKSAGFTGLLDKNTISINEKLGDFVRENLEKIQIIFDSRKTVKLETNKNLMCFVNDKLESIWGIKMVGKNKRTKGIDSKVYTIGGMDLWSETKDGEKPCITDKLQSLLRMV